MSLEATKQQTNQPVEPEDLWEPPMPPTDLIFDDGEPLESNRHRIAMNTLIRSLQERLKSRNDFFTGGNMFIYYSSAQVRNRDFKGPDFFVVLDIDGTQQRQGWVVWDENGRYPDVIVELLSESTAEIDKTTKKQLYERVFKTPDYFIYDPFDTNFLQGWHLNASQRYQALAPDNRGWLWCETLQLWLGTWQGIIDREDATWLRFYDADGNLVLLPEEAEKQRADEEKQRADEEKQRADEEKQRAELLAAKLRELGLDPDNL